MRSTIAYAVLASLAVSACGGGGQTEPTEAEESLNNELQPAAPSPGAAGPNGEVDNGSTGQATSAENSQ